MVEIPTRKEQNYKMSDYEEYLDRFADLIHAVTQRESRDLDAFLRQKLQQNPHCAVLELGYGMRYFLADLANVIPPNQIYGIDNELRSNALGYLKSILPLKNLKNGDVHELINLYTTKHGLQQFDVMIASNLSMWLRDPTDVFFKQAYRMLHPKGILLVNTVSLEDMIPNPEERRKFIEDTTQHLEWVWIPRKDPSKQTTYYHLAIQKPLNDQYSQHIIEGLKATSTPEGSKHQRYTYQSPFSS